MEFVCAFSFILGVINVFNFYFLVLVREIKKVGTVLGNKVYNPRSIKVIELSTDYKLLQGQTSKKLIKYYLSMEIRQYFFSKSYDLAKTLQMNFLKISDESRMNFIMNKQIMLNLHKMTNGKGCLEFNQLVNYWCREVINGFYSQMMFEINGSVFEILLIARKESQNLGTRYNRRGLNESAFVANFVEVEQIVINKTLSSARYPVCSSYVQVRGSVPMYWYQNIKVLDPKPTININNSVETVLGMKIHLSDLNKRYGSQINILNLLFQKENYLKPKSEAYLSEAYQNLFEKEIMKHNCEICFTAIDLKNLMKVNKENLFGEINRVFQDSKSRLGKFLINRICDSENDSFNTYVEIQKGVTRTNCVDCLDRTNVAQSAMSLLMIEEQLSDVMNFIPDQSYQNAQKSKIQLNIKFQEEIFKNWELLGDIIAIEYAGSKAHNLVSKDKAKLLVKRYISNVFSDKAKQLHINFMQNDFKPLKNEFHLESYLAAEAEANSNIIRNSNILKQEAYRRLENYAFGNGFLLGNSDIIDLEISKDIHPVSEKAETFNISTKQQGAKCVRIYLPHSTTKPGTETLDLKTRSRKDTRISNLKKAKILGDDEARLNQRLNIPIELPKRRYPMKALRLDDISDVVEINPDTYFEQSALSILTKDSFFAHEDNQSIGASMCLVRLSTKDLNHQSSQKIKRVHTNQFALDKGVKIVNVQNQLGIDNSFIDR